MFPEKNKLALSVVFFFHLKCVKLKQNGIVCIDERLTLKINFTDLLIFNFKVLRLPPLHMQKTYLK